MKTHDNRLGVVTFTEHTFILFRFIMTVESKYVTGSSVYIRLFVLNISNYIKITFPGFRNCYIILRSTKKNRR